MLHRLHLANAYSFVKVLYFYLCSVKLYLFVLVRCSPWVPFLGTEEPIIICFWQRCRRNLRLWGQIEILSILLSLTQYKCTIFSTNLGLWRWLLHITLTCYTAVCKCEKLNIKTLGHRKIMTSYALVMTSHVCFIIH